MTRESCRPPFTVYYDVNIENDSSLLFARKASNRSTSIKKCIQNSWAELSTPFFTYWNGNYSAPDIRMHLEVTALSLNNVAV
jgi:hypothetical protein